MGRKTVAAVLAAALLCAAAAKAYAAEGCTAVVGFADTLFTAQDWETSVSVTGDGQYSIESVLAAGAQDIGVFVIDIKGMSKEYPGAKAVLDKIEIDGKEVDFDPDKVAYKTLDDGSFRIEIVNQYNEDAPSVPAVERDLTVSSSLKAEFTVSGLDGAAGEAPETLAETEASESVSEEEVEFPEVEDVGAAAPAVCGDLLI